MPELPEVETLRLNLEKHILDKSVQHIDVHDARLRWPVRPNDLMMWVQGETIHSLSRRSKYLVIHLSNNAAVIIHLGMSGRLGLFSHGVPLEKHTHVVFHLEDGLQIRYRDPRRFGLVEVSAPGELENYPRFRHLGVEPLSRDFNTSYVQTKLRRSKKAIKLWITDAQNVVGVGNIYANEALFKAGIHPARPANSLESNEQRKLASSVKSTLRAALKMGGTTINDFRNANGEPGFFQQVLSVYQKEGEPCTVCGSKIIKTVLSGRSTFFCPTCQT